MPFSRQMVDDIRMQADIVRVVNDYVALKKRGVNYIACCPFHQEKTPSFNVNPAKQVFKCFGCGVGGNVFSFVMNIEKATFPEAVRIVAQKVGIPIVEEEAAPERQEQEAERERLLLLHEWATEYFVEQLSRSEGRIAAAYLDERGISDETRRAMRFGYAPDGWEGLSGYLRRRGAAAAEIEKSGLVTVKDSGRGFYDRFRGRLMIPIADAQGRTIAFGGRILGSGEPKYLNSPETPIYSKGRNLFGLHLAKDAIRRRGFVILVEGYFDFIVPFQAGIHNIVASLGTALTENQVRLMRRFLEHPRVVVNFDPDAAGQNAARRSLEVFLEQGFKVNILRLPDGDDPDEFVRAHGGEGYREQLKRTMPAIDFLLDRACREYDVSRPSGKASAVNLVLPFLASMKDSIERALYVERVSDRLKVDDRVLREELKKNIVGERPPVAAARVATGDDIPPIERALLVAMLSDDTLCAYGLERMDAGVTDTLATAYFFTALRRLFAVREPISFDSLRAVLLQIRAEENLRAQGGQRSMFDEADGSGETVLGDVVENLLAQLLLEAEPPEDAAARDALKAQLDANLHRLDEERLRQERAILQRRIAEAERQGDTTTAAALSTEMLKIARTLNGLRQSKRNST